MNLISTGSVGLNGIIVKCSRWIAKSIGLGGGFGNPPEAVSVEAIRLIFLAVK